MGKSQHWVRLAMRLPEIGTALRKLAHDVELADVKAKAAKRNRREAVLRLIGAIKSDWTDDEIAAAKKAAEDDA